MQVMGAHGTRIQAEPPAAETMEPAAVGPDASRPVA
jgi:hypothetical protein